MDSVIIFNKEFLDLSTAKSSTEMLLKLNNILEDNNLKGKKLKLMLGNIVLTPDNIHSLKSIIESLDSEIEIIYTKCLNTQLAALGAGLAVSEKIPTAVPDSNNESQDNSQNIQLDIPEQIDEMSGTNFEESAEQYETEKILEEIMDQEDECKKQPKESNITGIKTLYLKQTLRSGQTVNFDGNVVIIGDCHSGSEIIATGDITVWGLLKGVAHAGTKGNANACIRALKINAIQLRIANFFARKPDRFDFEKVEKLSVFVPEEAKVSNNEIKIYSLNG